MDSPNQLTSSSYALEQLHKLIYKESFRKRSHSVLFATKPDEKTAAIYPLEMQPYLVWYVQFIDCMTNRYSYKLI